MAIQVSGTTVLNNSRQLTNITGADAATVAALGSAGIGGSASWSVVATYTNNTERYGTHQTSTATLGSLPSSPQVKGFGYHVKFDNKVTTTSGTKQWNVKVLISNSNSWSSNSYLDLQNWDSYQTANQWFTFEKVQIWSVSQEAYRTDTNASAVQFGQQPIGVYTGLRNNSSVSMQSGVNNFSGGSWAAVGSLYPTNSNFPGFTPSSTWYTGYHLNFDGGYSTGYIRNFSVKMIALY